MGSHTEALQVVYDPAVIDYGTLLETFWSDHRPLSMRSRQYRSAIFVGNDAERTLAEESLQRRSVELGARLTTAIEPAGPFHPAEDYHQKYRLRRHQDVVQALLERHGRRWIDSTDAARLNGLFGGRGLQEPVESMHLKGPALAAVSERVADSRIR